MRRFNLKKQARKERHNDKALEEFSRSAEQERGATITVGNRQVEGTIRKTGPSSLEFIERPLIDDNPWDSHYKKERPLDRALLIIHAGKALYLDHIGPGIDYYLSECPHDEDEWSEPNGVYIWEGKFISRVITHFEGDKDYEEELETTSMRLATLEEWQAHINDEYVWDRSEWLLPEHEETNGEL